MEKKEAVIKPDTKSNPQVKEGATSSQAKVGKIYATGKRKTAIAKVWLAKQGSGKITVNGKLLTDYFERPMHKMLIRQPFNMLKTENVYDVECQVLGSGSSGQAGSIKHGISKALALLNEDFRKTLRNCGFLTRDSRRVERQKYGQRGARAKYQYSKR
jgi:small subunit ribosomal protein S9